MLRLLAAIAVVVPIVAICASLGEDGPAIHDGTQQPPVSCAGLSGLPAMLCERLAVRGSHKRTLFRISH